MKMETIILNCQLQPFISIIWTKFFEILNKKMHIPVYFQQIHMGALIDYVDTIFRILKPPLFKRQFNIKSELFLILMRFS